MVSFSRFRDYDLIYPLALSVDSIGNVGVWDILRGSWKGGYAFSEVRSLLDHGVYSPREALEVIRTRIEGEEVVSPWCSLDTKTGVLTVYLVERACFDAEVYADEVGFKNEKGFNDESKRKFPSAWKSNTS